MKNFMDATYKRKFFPQFGIFFFSVILFKNICRKDSGNAYMLMYRAYFQDRSAIHIFEIQCFRRKYLTIEKKNLVNK